MTHSIPAFLGRTKSLLSLGLVTLFIVLVVAGCGDGKGADQRIREVVEAWTGTGLAEFNTSAAVAVAEDLPASISVIEAALAEGITRNLNWAIVDTQEVEGGKIRAEVQLEAPFNIQIGDIAASYNLRFKYNLLVRGDVVEEAVLVLDSLNLISASPLLPTPTLPAPTPRPTPTETAPPPTPSPRPSITPFPTRQPTATTRPAPTPTQMPPAPTLTPVLVHEGKPNVVSFPDAQGQLALTAHWEIVIEGPSVIAVDYPFVESDDLEVFVTFKAADPQAKLTSVVIKGPGKQELASTKDVDLLWRSAFTIQETGVHRILLNPPVATGDMTVNLLITFHLTAPTQ
ncbi:MAG: hypothetical protein C1O27_001577 [Chloroflexi bacterium]|nr:MAG: hypothetical protein C1O27_001577 [Chloroflexota bacterium]